MIQEFLLDVGLSKNEAKIYRMLLEFGPSLVGEISSRAKIHRRNVYDSILRLKEKGFVSWTIRNNRKYFEAVSPQRVIDIFEEKKQKIKAIMPQIMEKQKSVSQAVKVYTGREGRKIIFDDKLRHKEEQLVLGAHEPTKGMSMQKEIYHKMRIARKIPLKMLFPLNETEAAKKFSKLKYASVRILPKSMRDSPIAINIYGSKVAFLTKSEEQPLSILIEDKNLADDFRNYFFALWKILEKV